MDKIDNLLKITKSQEFLTLDKQKQEELLKTYVTKIFLTDLIEYNVKNEEMVVNLLEALT